MGQEGDWMLEAAVSAAAGYCVEMSNKSANHNDRRAEDRVGPLDKVLQSLSRRVHSYFVIVRSRPTA